MNESESANDYAMIPLKAKAGMENENGHGHDRPASESGCGHLGVLT